MKKKKEFFAIDYVDNRIAELDKSLEEMHHIAADAISSISLLAKERSALVAFRETYSSIAKYLPDKDKK